jgi:hypothetical protein
MMNTVLQYAVMLVLLAVPGYAAERLVLYDDFNAAQINPDRWLGGQSSSVFPHWGTEAIRQIQDHQLRLMYRSYGATTAASGTIRSEFTLISAILQPSRPCRPR